MTIMGKISALMREEVSISHWGMFCVPQQRVVIEAEYFGFVPSLNGFLTSIVVTGPENLWKKKLCLVDRKDVDIGGPEAMRRAERDFLEREFNIDVFSSTFKPVE